MEELPPQIEQVVTGARDLYVSHYVLFLSAFADKKIITEAVLLDKDGNPYLTGSLHLPMRSDVFEVGGGMSMIPSDQQLDFSSLSFDFKGARVLLEPFVWDQIAVTADIAPNEMASAVLVDWFQRQFKSDIISGDGKEINCIHFMSAPKAVPAGLYFELDLGTANASAFSDLLNALVTAGSTEIVVQSTEEGQR